MRPVKVYSVCVYVRLLLPVLRVIVLYIYSVLQFGLPPVLSSPSNRESSKVSPELNVKTNIKMVTGPKKEFAPMCGSKFGIFSFCIKWFGLLSISTDLVVYRKNLTLFFLSMILRVSFPNFST